jgi:hypothetical protein
MTILVDATSTQKRGILTRFKSSTLSFYMLDILPS